MALRYRCDRPLTLLSDARIREIHAATLRVLERVGVKFADEEALSFLAEHGCDVDFAEQVARIPSSLVEACLERCPASFRLRAQPLGPHLTIPHFSCYAC